MVIILMGVSGSGKTTIGKLLAEQTGFAFYDGDDYHPQANIEKMSKGQPLTDDDRVLWIQKLIDIINRDKNENKIIACSALTKNIRRMLRSGAEVAPHFVFLKGSFDSINQRMQRRQGHFFKADLLKSQFDALEEPGEALVVDIENSPEQICRTIIDGIMTRERALKEKL